MPRNRTGPVRVAILISGAGSNMAALIDAAAAPDAPFEVVLVVSNKQDAGGLTVAAAKGVPTRVVVWRHALRNCLIPVVTVVGLYLGILIGNSVLTEIVFNRPGLGKLIVGALAQRDYTMLQGLMVIYTLIVVGVNMLTDVVYAFVDPRVKLQ